MRHLNGVYTQRYNRLHGYDGQLFRGRFKSILVEEDSYLLELVRYIHRNPLRAGLVEMLGDYSWSSSHHGYLSTSKVWKWLNKKKHREVPESAQLAPERQHITREIRRFYGVKNKDILTSQRGKSNEPRDVAIYLCRILRNDTLLDLGQAFGMTGYSPASSAVERLKKNMVKNKELQQKIKQIKTNLFARKGQAKSR